MTRHRTIGAALASTCFLAACETPSTQQAFTATPDARMSESQARNECDFEVQAATETFANTRVAPDTSFEEAMGDAIADGLIRGDEENRLFTSCMRAKGFVRV